MGKYKKITDYGLIGNLDTCVLIGNDGSIDWCCFPHLESPSVFAALLDKDKGGYFSVCPKGWFKSESRYFPDTNVLETTFWTARGKVKVTDFMLPISKTIKQYQRHALWRKVEGIKGSVILEVNFQPVFNYARSHTTIKNTPTGVVARADQEKLFLDVPFPLTIKNNRAVGDYSLKAGQVLWLTLQYQHHRFMNPASCQRTLNQIIKYWQSWSDKCQKIKWVGESPWRDLVIRSGLLLKLLTHNHTSAIAAAPTTSLPEVIGGERNWDYRYNWVRDSVFTIQALYNIGHQQESKKLLEWYAQICQEKEPEDIKVMYTLYGEEVTNEQELSHLSGYRNSRPVRVGNEAVRQRQNDIYGELLNAVYQTRYYGEFISEDDWLFYKKIVDYVCQIWNKPDAGIWEFRETKKHFVYSKVMCWVALDRGIKIAEQRGFEADIKKWQQICQKIKTAVLKKGFSQELNSFVQSFDSQDLDAANLLIPQVGFLSFTDKRVQGTINTTLKNLTKNGLVYRYLTKDGLSGQEGTFVLCTFWLINALILSGRKKEAEKLFNKILKYVSPLGLLAEQIDCKNGEQLGNFPQAFSHIGLINSAFYLSQNHDLKKKNFLIFK